MIIEGHDLSDLGVSKLMMTGVQCQCKPCFSPGIWRVWKKGDNGYVTRYCDDHVPPEVLMLWAMSGCEELGKHGYG